jgi:MFS family permease
MAMLEQEDAGSALPQLTATDLPKLSWARLLTISIFAFALNFHWGAIGTIIIPSQVAKIAGNLNEGSALAFVLIPGAFISLIANPLFGWLSDQTHGKLAVWGRRRPFILVGTLVNAAALVWMAAARDIPSLAIGYALVQLSSNAAQAPFHAILPDIVPFKQRGLTSGLLGLLYTAGTIGGVVIGGTLIDSSKPLALYEQEIWLVYSIIIVVLVALMLITIFTVYERMPAKMSAIVPAETPDVASKETPSEEKVEASSRRSWFSPALVNTLMITLVAALLIWGGMALWNVWHLAGIQINGTTQQVVLEVVVTIGILRLFDFRPRRDPDFAWVLLTRLLMMLGIYTIQDFLQYYMSNVVGATHPEQATRNFVILVALSSIVTALAAGWLSDRFGRKRIVYVSGVMMALVGLIFIVTHSMPIVIAAGALFGLGYGAYLSVDWALVVDVLPSQRNFARDMGVWNIALSMPQVIAPALGGPLIDTFTRSGHPVIGFQLIFGMAIVYCLVSTAAIRFIRGAK